MRVLLAASLLLLTLRRLSCFRRASRQRHAPLDALLVLGGCSFREDLAAKLLAGSLKAADLLSADQAAAYGAALQSRPVLVSSAHGGARQRFLATGVASFLLHVDETAVDTVTNFTTAYELYQTGKLGAESGGLRHVGVLTSAAHAPRASLVAFLTFGSCGVATTVLSLPDDPANPALVAGETRLRRLRDGMRSLCWALTGLSGGQLGRLVHPERFHHLDAQRKRR